MSDIFGTFVSMGVAIDVRRDADTKKLGAPAPGGFPRNTRVPKNPG
jgi:hypothetical protein